VTAPNPELKLKPGMTATLDVEVARTDNAVRVPAGAIRFKPTAEQLEAMNAAAVDNPKRQPIVWVAREGAVTGVPVRTGLSDGQWTELIDAPFAEGTEVVTRVASPTTSAPQASGAPNNPLMGTQPRRR
jgi:HlyD family secretion protein